MAMIDYGNDVTRAVSKIYDALKEYDKARERYDSQLAFMVAQSMELVNDSARLYEENDKLRHLASDMYKQLLNAYDPKELEEFADDLMEHGVVIDR